MNRFAASPGSASDSMVAASGSAIVALEGCLLERGIAHSTGGAVEASDLTTVLLGVGVTLANNTALRGGAVSLQGGTAALSITMLLAVSAWLQQPPPSPVASAALASPVLRHLVVIPASVPTRPAPYDVACATAAAAASAFPGAACFVANKALAGAAFLSLDGTFLSPVEISDTGRMVPLYTLPLSMFPVAQAAAVVHTANAVRPAAGWVMGPQGLPLPAPFPFTALPVGGVGYGPNGASPPTALVWVVAPTGIASALPFATGTLHLVDAHGNVVKWTQVAVEVSLVVRSTSSSGGGSTDDNAAVLRGSSRWLVAEGVVSTADAQLYSHAGITATLCAESPGIMSACTVVNTSPCPAGYGVSNTSVVLASGQVLPPACVPCVPGDYGAGGVCAACGAGTVAPAAESTACQACPAGTTAFSGVACNVCPAGFFSFTGDVSCSPCPGCHACASEVTSVADAFQCTGSGLLQLGDGVWWAQGAAFTPATQFYACKPDRCAVRGNRTVTSPHTDAWVECATHYGGILCEECAGDAARAGSSCIACWPAWVNALVVAASICAAAGLLGVLVARKNREQAFERRVERAAANVPGLQTQFDRLRAMAAPKAVARIVINFAQLLSIVGSFKIRGPELFQRLTGFTDAAGGSALDVAPVACLLRPSYLGVFYTAMITPLVLIVAGMVYARVSRALARRRGEVPEGSYRLALVSNICVLLFFMYVLRLAVRG